MLHFQKLESFGFLFFVGNVISVSNYWASNARANFWIKFSVETWL